MLLIRHILLYYLLFTFSYSSCQNKLQKESKKTLYVFVECN